MSALTPRTHWLWHVALAALVWSCASWLANGNLDSYHDMLENHAWGQHWPLGTHKHPPLFAWTAAAWFAIVPEGDAAYRLLSYLNVAVALAGVVAFARAWARLENAALPTAALPTAALLLLWTLPYTTLAGKFNANTQLLSLWPWVAAALLMSWTAHGWRGWLATAALGVLSAAAMLSKYYSGIFLAGLLVPTLAHAAGRAWLASARPYVALAVFAAALAPHAQWLAAHDWPTLAYVGEQANTSGASGAHVNWRQSLRFALAPIFYWLPAWLALAAVYGWNIAQNTPNSPKPPKNTPNPEQTKGHFEPRLPKPRLFGAAHLRATLALLLKTWRPAGWGDALFWLAFTPWALTLGCGLAGIVELSTPWAIPIGYAYTLLWLRNCHAAAPQASAAVVRSLHKAQPRVLAAVLLLGAATGWVNAQKGQNHFYRPSAEAARAIVQAWHTRHDANQTLHWVSGSAWAESAILGFYADDHIRTVPEAPDSRAARVLGFDDAQWRARHGVFVCPLARVDDNHPARDVLLAAAGHGSVALAWEELPTALAHDACLNHARAWLQAHDRAASRVHLHVLKREGWPFSHPIFFAYAVLDYEP